MIATLKKYLPYCFPFALQEVTRQFRRQFPSKPAEVAYLPCCACIKEDTEEKRREEKRREKKEATSNIFNAGYFHKWFPP